MAVERVRGALEGHGFELSDRQPLDATFSRITESGARQGVQVLLDRYDDRVCARYSATPPDGSETPRSRSMALRGREIEYMRAHAPGWRPGEGEWVWYDGDDDFPRALDTLVSIIEGFGLPALEELSRPVGADEAEEPLPPAPREPGPDPVQARLVPCGKARRIELGDDAMAGLLQSTLGAALCPQGFSYVGILAGGWCYRRDVHGSFCTGRADRRGYYPVDTDTAEQYAIVRDCPEVRCLEVRLSTSTLYYGSGMRNNAIRRAFGERAEALYPEVLKGRYFPYEDEASYREAFRKVADVTGRYAAEALDAICERPEEP